MSNLDNATISQASIFCNESAKRDLMPGFFVHSMLSHLKYHVSFISLTVDKLMMVFKMTTPLFASFPYHL